MDITHQCMKILCTYIIIIIVLKCMTCTHSLAPVANHTSSYLCARASPELHKAALCLCTPAYLHHRLYFANSVYSNVYSSDWEGDLPSTQFIASWTGWMRWKYNTLLAYLLLHTNAQTPSDVSTVNYLLLITCYFCIFYSWMPFFMQFYDFYVKSLFKGKVYFRLCFKVKEESVRSSV